MVRNKNTIYANRIARVLKQLKSGTGSALLLSAPVPVRQSRGVEYPFRQESDLFYLTGFKGADMTLLLSARLKEPVIFVPRVDPVRVTWTGKGPDVKPIAQAIGAKVITSNDIEGEVLKLLRGIDTLYYQTRPGTVGQRIAAQLFNLDAYVRGGYPAHFIGADKLLAPLRLIKSADEVAAIRHAAAITNEALFSISPLISHRTSEAEIQETLEFVFRSCGARVAFHTIVAAGKNAATLHYHAHHALLKRGQMVLIDCGAEFEMYAADISRTLPVDGVFEPLQRVVYETVLEAQKAAIAAIKPGARMIAPYKAASLVIIEGLKELGVLRGSTRELFKKNAQHPFFPHGIGHSLGLDVHDVGEVRGNTSADLAEGMVVTIEPGLYFSVAHKKLPACGVRIEDDILVTRKGAEVLSEGFPKDPDELCQLIASPY